jgi:DNA polymerase-3 subunit delta
MIYLYAGENDFAVYEKVRLVCRAFQDKYSSGAIERLDGSEITSASLAAKLTSIDMFAPRKLVVLSNTGKKRGTWEALAQILPLVPDSTELVVVESKLDGRLSATKEIKKLAKTTEFKPLKPYEIEQWTRESAQKMHREIRSDAVKLLVEYCEYDQWAILHELEKLSRITKVISLDIVQRYVQPNLEVDIFQVLELAIGQNLTEVDKILTILQRKEDVNKFIGLLASQVFTLVSIKNSEGANVVRDIGLAPFLVTKQRALAAKISLEKLDELVARLADIDGRIKLGEDGWLLLKITFNHLFH